MIDKVQIGTRIIINSKVDCWYEDKGNVFEIERFVDMGSSIEMYTFEADNPQNRFNGVFLKKDFDYYGNHVNNEVIDLVSKHDIKSFQAVLDDGRIINYSCLN